MLFQAGLSARREALRQVAGLIKQARDITGLEVDDPDFPSRLKVTFRAPGFAPPEDELARPVHPVPRTEHTVQIALLPDYPVSAPVITWLSPVFHPNIADGAVCLPVSGTNLAAACQALIDLAAYRTYEVRPEDFGGGGFLNLAAAAWALSPPGQQQIIACGGTPIAGRRKRPRISLQLELAQLGSGTGQEAPPCGHPAERNPSEQTSNRNGLSAPARRQGLRAASRSQSAARYYPGRHCTQ